MLLRIPALNSVCCPPPSRSQSSGRRLAAQRRASNRHFHCLRAYDREPEAFEEPTEEERLALIRAPLIGRGAGSFDASEELAKDIAALRTSRNLEGEGGRRETGQPAWLENVNTGLVGVFFVVLFFGAWLLAGLAEERVLKTQTLSTVWLQLWPVVIQPALGVLMAASLDAGGAGWAREQAEARDAER